MPTNDNNPVPILFRVPGGEVRSCELIDELGDTPLRSRWAVYMVPGRVTLAAPLVPADRIPALLHRLGFVNLSERRGGGAPRLGDIPVLPGVRVLDGGTVLELVGVERGGAR